MTVFFGGNGHRPKPDKGVRKVPDGVKIFLSGARYANMH